MAMSTLCDLCQQIFQGRWIEKEAWELAVSLSSLHTASSDDSLDATQIDTNNSSADSGWYEGPDWVRVADGGSDADDLSLLPAESLISPHHHSIARLEHSALSGCCLCAALADVVRDKLSRLEDSTENYVSQLSAIAIVRQARDACDVENSLVLAISYFLDGKIEEDSYGFSVELILLPPQTARWPGRDRRIKNWQTF
jgi:hypothetical protein